MRDNMENFREISDIVLKDICATDELKRKTLEKCTDKRTFRINPAILSTASAAVLIIAFGLYNYFFHNPNVAINSHVNDQIKNEYKNPVDNSSSQSSKIIAENKPVADGKISIKKENPPSTDKIQDSVNAAENKDKNIVLKDSNSTSQTGIEDQFIAAEKTQEYGLTSAFKTLNMAGAEKYFGSSILVPGYIPEGFNLAGISIPDHKLKCIKLSYSSDTAYFEILQNKNLSELKGTKTISIENNKAYVNYTKDENSNTITTLIWTIDSIQYSLYGNLSEKILIDIAKSMN